MICCSSEVSNDPCIDDVNVTDSAVGFGDLPGADLGLNLVPIPTDGGLDVTDTLPGAGDGQLLLIDAQYRTVWSSHTRDLFSERVRLDARAHGLSAEVYTASAA